MAVSSRSYNELFLDHFQNPRNIGMIQSFNASCEAENETDSDKIKFFLDIKDGAVENISYFVKGCPRIIASCSYISELVKGMKTSEIEKIDKSMIRKNLGFTDDDFQCIDLPLYAIKGAVSEFKKNV